MAEDQGHNYLTLICICLFLQAGCTHSSQWQYQNMSSCTPAYNYAKLNYTPENLSTGIGIEILKGEKTQGFFNIYSGKISSAEGILWIDHSPIYFKGTLLEGKQRLALPPAITRDIIDSLQSGRHIIATLPGYYTEISQEDAPHAFVGQWHEQAK
jgi:hypothetical protein